MSILSTPPRAQPSLTRSRTAVPDLEWSSALQASVPVPSRTVNLLISVPVPLLSVVATETVSLLTHRAALTLVRKLPVLTEAASLMRLSVRLTVFAMSRPHSAVPMVHARSTPPSTITRTLLLLRAVLPQLCAQPMLLTNVLMEAASPMLSDAARSFLALERFVALTSPVSTTSVSVCSRTRTVVLQRLLFAAGTVSVCLLPATALPVT